MNIEPYANDPGHWGASLVTLSEVLLDLLDAVAPASVLEIGAYAGDVTRLLLQWSATSGAKITAVDPDPEKPLVALDAERPDLVLVRATSHEALADPDVPIGEVVIIDGDHNYYTVSEELRLIAERSGTPLPLLIFHDVSWPHARRDDYFAPELVPEDYRQPTVEGGAVFPGDPGLHPGGLPYKWPAAREGGPRNGVLTAVEDFVAAHQGLRLAVVPAFFGLGVAWPESAPWSAAVADIVAPWDRHPMLERMEANRVMHLAYSHHMMVEAARWQQRSARQEALLRKLLESKSFSVAERISQLRQGGEPAISKAEVRRALAD